MYIQAGRSGGTGNLLLGASTLWNILVNAGREVMQHCNCKGRVNIRLRLYTVLFFCVPRRCQAFGAFSV